MDTTKRLDGLKPGSLFRHEGTLWVRTDETCAVYRGSPEGWCGGYWCVSLATGGRSGLLADLEVTPIDLPALLAEREEQALIIRDLREDLLGSGLTARTEALRKCAALLYDLWYRMVEVPTALGDRVLAAAGEALGEPGAFTLPPLGPVPRLPGGGVSVGLSAITGTPDPEGDADA